MGVGAVVSTMEEVSVQKLTYHKLIDSRKLYMKLIILSWKGENNRYIIQMIGS